MKPVFFFLTHYIVTKHNQNNEHEMSQEKSISLVEHLDLKKRTTEAKFPIIIFELYLSKTVL